MWIVRSTPLSRWLNVQCQHSFSIELNQTTWLFIAQISGENQNAPHPTRQPLPMPSKFTPKLWIVLVNILGCPFLPRNARRTNNGVLFHSHSIHFCCMKFRRRADCIAGGLRAPNLPHRPPYYPTSIHEVGGDQRQRNAAACVSFR